MLSIRTEFSSLDAAKLRWFETRLGSMTAEQATAKAQEFEALASQQTLKSQEYKDYMQKHNEFRAYAELLARKAKNGA